MLTKTKLALLLIAPLVGGVATFAAADSGGPTHQELIQKFDKNGDGKLDDAERAQMKAAFAARRAERKAERLAKYDTNKDGKLEPNERLAMRDDLATQRFRKLDANGDGKLTLDEFKAGAQMRHHGRHGHLKTRSTPKTPGAPSSAAPSGATKA